MRILIEDFGGMVPSRLDTLLPPNMARTAVNADLESGMLEPITLPEKIHTFADTTRRAVRVPDTDNPGDVIWMGFASRYARFFPGPLVNDSFKRHIWLDNNEPGTPQRLVQNSLQRMRDGDDPRLLGVPAPDTAMTINVVGGAGPVVDRAYVYTLVNEWGEEGAPSPPTSASGNISGSWNITGLALPSGIVAADRGITKYRIYRTVTGASGTAFYRVADVTLPTTTYNDTRTDVDVADDALLLESVSWAEPVAMEGFIEMPGGFFAGWNGRTIHFSEPYRPWAWPAEYDISVAYDVIGAGTVGNSLVLFTTAKPVIVSGTRPENMQIIESDAPEPCFYPNGVVTSPEGVYFIGRTGLFIATQSGLDNLTRGIIRQRDWQEQYQLTNLSAARINDTQILVLSTDGFGFVLDRANSRSALIRIENLEPIDSVWNDPYTGEVHALFANSVFLWQAPDANNAIAKWESKEFHLANPVNLGAMQVTFASDAESYVNQPFTESIITLPNPIVPGGPWLEESALLGYTLLNGCEYNASPSPDPGALPPGASPPADAWPYWFGILPADNDPELDIALPPGVKARVEVYADDVLRFSEFMERGQRRLPSGYKSDRYRFKIVTRVPILRFVVAETGKELAEV